MVHLRRKEVYTNSISLSRQSKGTARGQSSTFYIFLDGPLQTPYPCRAMARALRIQYPDAFYHVFSRGVEKREIFADDQDRKKFLRLLEELHPPLRFVIHSYCLMPNHYHLYVQTPLPNLSKVMKDLNSRYTQSFNRRHGRVGILFQGRYKALLVEEESYSLEISRYIHLNPVRAHLVSRPDDYPWSSYPAFLGLRTPENFLRTDWLLSQIGVATASQAGGAGLAFQRFTEEGLSKEWDPWWEARGRVLLGGKNFLSRIREKYLPGKRDRSISRLREMQRLEGEADLPQSIQQMIEAMGESRKIRRQLLIYALRKYTPLTLKEVGKIAGSMQEVAVSQSMRRLEEKRARDPHLRRWIEEIDDRMCKM